MVMPRTPHTEMCQVEFPARGVLAAEGLSSPSTEDKRTESQ